MCLPVSKWRYEVEAAVNPVVHYVSSVQTTLIMKVSLKLIVNVLDDGLEADIKGKQPEKQTKASLITPNKHVNTILPSTLRIIL